jgi:hypothetical protein
VRTLRERATPDFVVAAAGIAGIKVAVLIPPVRTASDPHSGYDARNSLVFQWFGH